jgi:hypothetical protein
VNRLNYPKLTEYTYTARLTGNIYHPGYKDGFWYICDTPTTLLHIAALCEIPDNEILIFKLKYGG